MGVFRLLSHCLQHREACVEYVDLVEAAREQGGVQILVDYYSFQQLLVNKFWKSLSNVTGNPHLRLLGGEYRALDEYVTKLVRDLQSLDIHLVMFVDGSKGSSKVGTEQKLETWKSRHTRDLQNLRDIIDVIERRRPIQDLPHDVNIRPVLLEVQMMETLKECKCEVVQCPYGEADFVIARNLHSRPQALAILSNDSDFCIFPSSKFIPNELFDLQNDLQLGGNQSLPDKPIRLMCGMIRAGKVVRLLELEDQKDLVEVSIIAGNDFTTNYVKRLKGKIGLEGRNVTDVADWVRQHGRVENHPVLARAMDHDQDFRDAVHRTRQFYSLEAPPHGAGGGGGMLSLILEENITSGNFPPAIMGMHKSFYWYRMLLEDPTHGQPCAESALSDLRTFIYRMVLDPKVNSVVEYGRVPYEDFSSHMVRLGRPDRFLDVANVQKDKIFQNLRTFHRVMTHNQPGASNEWYKRYGWNVGYMCYMIRYFIVLNTRQNLHMSEGEFLPLIAMVFCKVDERWYQSLNILPSLRCITVGNWFQDVIRHAYQFLGKLLFLSHEFNAPKSLFSGAVWAAFYMVSNFESQLRGPGGIPNPSIQRIRKDMSRILQEKRHMMSHVVQGYFEISSR